jgi:hypothetical protein
MYFSTIQVDDLIPFIEDGKGWTSESMFRERHWG